jgi:hypothetical protein
VRRCVLAKGGKARKGGAGRSVGGSVHESPAPEADADTEHPSKAGSATEGRATLLPRPHIRYESLHLRKQAFDLRSELYKAWEGLGCPCDL